MYIEEIEYQDPVAICSHFAHTPGTIFMDSSKVSENLGRYSFIGIDPIEIITSKNNNPFPKINKIVNSYKDDFIPELPPFQGGLAGFFSYDLKNYLEELPSISKDDMDFPDLYLGVYDLVIGFDNLVNRAWIFSRAKSRYKWLLEQLKKIYMPNNIPELYCTEQQITSNFTRQSYEQAVQKVINYILSGDIFQANISQRFSAKLPKKLSAFDLYRRLRNINPADFSAFINANNTYIASSSPERFIKLQENIIESRPIKGTRPRHENPKIDQQLATELFNSKKDRAENTMIVDLMRNDLSKVCLDHSVQVSKLCEIESFQTVHHLVSVINAKLAPEYNPIDLFKATFPGGSITGAPKIRAMQIIDEIEPTQRGPYCGSIGYIGFNGNMDLSIAIRTFAIKNSIVTFQAGGAIVLDSDPSAEYFESLDKARALYEALAGKNIE